MLTLLLLRHAKSSWDTPDLSDHDRPLNQRGLDAAPRVGAFIKKNRLVPDLVLCSTSVRTRATLELVLPFFDPRPQILFEEDLYLAESGRLLNRLRLVKADVKRAMMIGHNPGFEDLARELAAHGEKSAIDDLRRKFPTAGLAVIDFSVSAWSRIGPGAGRLAHFVTPRGLAEADH